MDVRAELGTALLNLADIINMEVGDVIVLDNAVSDEAILKIEGVPKFKGYPGIFKGNKAIKISSILTNKED